MRVLIVDDEPPARERLKRLIEDLPDYEVAGEATNGHEALERCNRDRPEIVLMDIRMPGMDGIEATQHLTALDDPPAVIFTTAFNEYAVEAFEAQAVGYLMKPIRRERLARVLASATRLTRPQLAAISRSDDKQCRDHICAKVRDELRLIAVDDILYFQADQKYVCVRHTRGEVLIDESLKSLEDEFHEQFVRIHRNALVALRHLRSVNKNPEGMYVALIKGYDEPLTVSRRHVSQLRKRLRSV